MDCTFEKALNIFLEKNFLSPINTRRLKMLKHFEPSLTNNALSLITLLFICNEQGDTRICLNADYIKEICTRKFGKGDAINAFSNSAIKAIVEIGNYKNIVGTSENTATPFILADDALYIQKYYLAKGVIIERIRKLFSSDKANNLSQDNLEKEIKKIQEKISPTPHENQAEAIVRGEKQNLIITGGPGTGKTTVVFNILANILEHASDPSAIKIHLGAPSGKAASRMDESIKNTLATATCSESIKNVLKALKGETIHRMLRYKPNSNNFFYNQSNQFEENSVFVIDEASMIDISMFANLLSAIPDNSRVFLLGDENQLPSVEAGAVLGDLLGSMAKTSNGCVVRLTKSFRSIQQIKELADNVNEASETSNPNFNLNWTNDIDIFDSLTTDWNGKDKSIPKVLALNAPSTKSFPNLLKKIVDVEYTPFEKDLQKLIEKASEHFKIENAPKLIDQKTNEELFDAASKAWKFTKHIKILCATHTGIHGTTYFNKELLEMFLIAHPLMINTNLYSYSLYNGDTGIAFTLNIGSEDDPIFDKFVMFERPNGFEFFTIDSLNESSYETSFAMTIHKSQGSEYDDVIMVLPENKENPLLSKQIIYTGITRAKNHCITISSEELFKIGACRKEPRETGIVL